MNNEETERKTSPMKDDAEAAQVRRGAATRMRMDEKRPLRDQVLDERGTPLVTVFVPTYNHARFIGQCLEAILDQVTDFPIEIIVNDDASTDETPVILQSYQQRYPALFRCHLQKTNLLHAHRRFEGQLHRMARGVYMAQCDGDDYWRDPDKLQKQVDFLEGHPKYVMSFHDAIEIDVDGSLLRPHNLPEAARRDYTADELRCLKWGWMLTQSMVYRKVFDEFPPEYFLTPNEDNFLPFWAASAQRSIRGKSDPWRTASTRGVYGRSSLLPGAAGCSFKVICKSSPTWSGSAKCRPRENWFSGG